MVDPDLATLFSNCFPNTLDTTVYDYQPSSPTSPPSTFVITGDIPAQWFRDSSNQLLPYVRLAPQDPELRDLICGLIHRHAADVAHDPYANAFNFNASGAGHQDDQRTPPMTKEVFEGKYELDSLAAVLKLASEYWKVTGDKTCFLTNQDWTNSMTILLQAIQSMQSEEKLTVVSDDWMRVCTSLIRLVHDFLFSCHRLTC
jgi:meiotically up-regulated gene 157 (Mug157) protein